MHTVGVGWRRRAHAAPLTTAIPAPAACHLNQPRAGKPRVIVVRCWPVRQKTLSVVLHARSSAPLRPCGAHEGQAGRPATERGEHSCGRVECLSSAATPQFITLVPPRCSWGRSERDVCRLRRRSGKGGRQAAQTSATKGACRGRRSMASCFAVNSASHAAAAGWRLESIVVQI